MKSARFRFFSIALGLALFGSFFNVSNVFSMAEVGAVLEREGGEALARESMEAALEGTEGGLSKVGNAALEDAGTTVDQFAKLPAEEQAAFIEKLGQEFKNMDASIFKNENFAADTSFKNGVGTARDNFLSEKFNLSPEEQAPIEQMAAKSGKGDVVFEEYKPRAQEEQIKVDGEQGFVEGELKGTPKDIETAQTNLAKEKADLKALERSKQVLEKTGKKVGMTDEIDSQIAKKAGSVKALQKDLDGLMGKNIDETAAKSTAADTKVDTSVSKVDDASTPKESNAAQEQLAADKQAATDAKQEAAEADNKSSELKKQQAEDAKYGTKETQAQIKDADTKFKAAKKAKYNSDYEMNRGNNPDAQSKYKIPGNDNTVTVKEYNDWATQNFDGAKNDLRVARENGGTESKLVSAKNDMAEAKTEYTAAKKEFDAAEKTYNAEKAKVGGDETKLTQEQKDAYSNAKTKFDEAQTKLDSSTQSVKEANEADMTAKEKYEAAKAEWEQNSTTWEAWASAKKTAGVATIKEQLIMGIVGGFAFTIPNIIVAPIQAAMAAGDRRQTLLYPQLFGGMWMQIPNGLIAPAGEPATAYYLYTSIPESPSKSTVSRSSDADTNSYLKKADFFTSISPYDEYASAAIIDPTFSELMIHANTGFKFLGDGVPANVASPVVPLLVADQAQPQAKTLRMHLDKMYPDVNQGVKGVTYFEERNQPTGYDGEPVIADQLDRTNNKSYIQKNFPGLALDEAFGSVMNKMMDSFVNGTKFGPFNVCEFKPLDSGTYKALGGVGEQSLTDVPFVGEAKYIYQTADTEFVKNAREQAQNTDPTRKAAIAKLADYVVMLDDDWSGPMPLQMPDAAGSQYGVPYYQLNPDAKYMVSLISGYVYDSQGRKIKNPGIDLSKAVPTTFSNQISVMKKYIMDQMQNGPFNIGGATLTIDPKLSDKGVYAYKIANSLEGGGDDYVIAIGDGKVLQLPDPNVSYFVSLVTSRFYTATMMPYNRELGGKKDTSFVVFKDGAGGYRVVTFSGSTSKLPVQQCGSGVNSNCWVYEDKAPMYTLFMDPDVNPNKPNKAQQDQLAATGMQANEVGVLPTLNQWVLSKYGPTDLNYPDSTGKKGTPIGTILQERAASFKTTVDSAYTAWKKYYDKQDPSVIERETGLFPFTQGNLQNIMLRATSQDDIENGNFVYTSPSFPNEYLALSNDAMGTQNFAKEYSISSPQRYAISLSSGNVYDSQAADPTEPLPKTLSVDTIMRNAQSVSPFLSALLKKVEASQQAFQEAFGNQQYGPDTMFGPFRFYLAKADLQNKQYIYGDVSNIKDPLSMDPKKLEDEIQDYFVAYEKGDGTTQDNYGTKIGAKTTDVLSLVSGSWYNRGGVYLGSQSDFKTSADGAMDIQAGFFNTIYNMIVETWKSQKLENTTMRPALKSKIQKLLGTQYQQLLKEKKEISDREADEKKFTEPLDANTIANLKAAKFVEELKAMSPPRYVKLYNKKYYGVETDPKTNKTQYVDYDVQIKDNSGNTNSYVGMYNDDGSVIAMVRGWTADNIRAFAGVVVNSDGTQELNVAVDSPSIPVDGMVKLETKALEKAVAAAEGVYKKARAAYVAKVSKATTDALAQASQKLTISTQELQAAKVIADAGFADSTWATFYFNETLSVYFMKYSNKGTEFYVDMVGGNQFYTNGHPMLSTHPMYKNTLRKDDYMIVGTDSSDLFTAMLPTIGVPGSYSSLRLINGSTSISVEDQQTKYQMRTNDTFAAYNIYKKDDQYTTYLLGDDSGSSLKTGIYNPEAGNKYSLLRYFKTRTKSDLKGTYVSDDYRYVCNPVFIIWAGDEKLELQKLLYKNQLITLTASGKTAYTGAYIDNSNYDNKQMPITITKNEQKHGVSTAHYVTILDGDTSYDFMYDHAMLDPNIPYKQVDTDAVDIHSLNYWKQIVWGLNVVVDSFGSSRLLTFLPNLLQTPQATVSAISAQELKNPNVKKLAAVAGRGTSKTKAKEFLSRYSNVTIDGNTQYVPTAQVKKLTDNVKRAKKDPSENRFVYRLSSTTDKNLIPGFNEAWDGWYVDLSNGVLYGMGYAGPGNDIGNYYPVTTMLSSQLAFLLDSLMLSVAKVDDPKGEQLYDTDGNKVVVGGKPVKVRPGLVYRSSKIVKQESEKTAG